MLTAVVLAGGDITEAIKKDRTALQGTWKVTASEQFGEKVPPEDIADLFLIFKGDAIHIKEGGKTEEKFGFLLDPSKKPKEIDLTIKFGPKRGQVDRAVYEISGDTARICIQTDKDAPRPRDFASRAGTKTWLVVLQRTKD
jgi:uncharacterized protein (TIGR03067 family)